MSLHYDLMETRLGWMGLLSSAKGARRTTLPLASPEECVSSLGDEIESAEWSPERFEGLKSLLAAYFEGEPVSFRDEPIDVADASPFLQAAWTACRSIPYGETRTYSWLAARAGSPRAARAAGQCMARNRLPIVVPCQRIVASDGGLGGFGRDGDQLELKRALLDLEAGVSEL